MTKPTRIQQYQIGRKWVSKQSSTLKAHLHFNNVRYRIHRFVGLLRPCGLAVTWSVFARNEVTKQSSTLKAHLHFSNVCYRIHRFVGLPRPSGLAVTWGVFARNEVTKQSSLNFLIRPYLFQATFF